MSMTISNRAKLRRCSLAACIATLSPLTAMAAVTSCADNNTDFDTLRHAILVANTGDTVDASGLMCSTITLTAGAIAVTVPNLTIKGPGAAALTIDAHHASQVFLDSLTATKLTLQQLTVANGTIAADKAYGGCIYSKSDLELDNVTVTGCHAAGVSLAAGGGVVVTGELTLVNSQISGNSAVASTGIPGSSNADGGGFFAFSLYAKGSVVSNNNVHSPLAKVYGGGGLVRYLSTIKTTTFTGNTSSAAATNSGNLSYGGGISAGSTLHIYYSTFDNNVADGGGGIIIHDPTDMAAKSIIRNTTISGNTANLGGGGIVTNTKLQMTNSTVAFNLANGSAGGGGVFFGGDVLQIGSTIIADNTSAGIGAGDLTVNSAPTTQSIVKSLIKTSNVTLPAATITLDPILGPLQNNGGLTRTHAIAPGSPAVDTGADVAGLNFDQRGVPYFRFSGPAPDIGAFEYQDTIFASGFEPQI
jgi:hypothetical protein